MSTSSAATAPTGFAVSYLADNAWTRNGLRAFYAYRDLGVAAATGRRWRAHHIRILDAGGAKTGWHCHDLAFQLVYVLRGFVRFLLDDREVVLRAGDCTHIPAFTMHDEIEYSADFEVLEITSPADVTTLTARPLPLPERPRARFAESHLRETDFVRGSGPRAFLEYRDLGVIAATDRRVQAQVVRTRGPCDQSTGWHHHTLDFQFVYVLDGWVRTALEGLGEFTLRAGDAMSVPGRLRHDVTAFSPDFTVLELNAPADFDTIAG
jgi:quercetin dioxygenase-like cupin family protein